jgi:Protein of unknown function (DUF1552)
VLDKLIEEWRLMADLYALAIQCDRVRFGSITFLSAGERIRMKGKYEYDGRKIFEFDDAGQRKTSGSAACSHEWWHDFNEKNKNEQLRAHAHMKMREVAYFLQRLDSSSQFRPNRATAATTMSSANCRACFTPSRAPTAASKPGGSSTSGTRGLTSTTRCSRRWEQRAGWDRLTGIELRWRPSEPEKLG